MSSGSGNNKYQKNRRRRRCLRPQFLFACFILIATLSLIGFLVAKIIPSEEQMNEKTPASTSGVGVATQPSESDVASTTESLQKPTIPSGYGKAYSDIHRGALVLVSNDHDYTFPEIELITALKKKTSGYLVRDYSILMEKEAFWAFDNMLSDFAKATGKKNVQITSAYRSRELQENVYQQYEDKYGKEYAESYVTRPGGSEHHTGLSVDLSIYNIDSHTSYEFTGKGAYSWVKENCAKYGIILRYTADKEEITGIAEETWHYRYVGVPHAAYMMEKGICLEEYINMMYDHPVTNPLNYGGYSIYYCPEDALCVPYNQRCTISGNNIDGYIVAATDK